MTEVAMTQEEATAADEIVRDTIFERDVLIEKMFVHYRDLPGGYARPGNRNRVEKLVNDFQAQAVGVLLLSLRDDGTYAVIDGQHRMEAARQVGMTTLDAYIYIDLTLEEEADLYRRFGDYLKQTALDRYLAGLTAQTPEILALDRMLAEIDMRVSRTGTADPGTVVAVSSMQRVATDFGPQMLRDTLRFLHDAFGRNHKGYSSSAIYGTALFLMRFAKHSKFQRKRLVEKMRAEGAPGVQAAAIRVKAADRSTGGNAWGKAMMAIHDGGLREENRLSVWPAQVLTEEGKAAHRANVAKNASPASANARRLARNVKVKALASCPDCRAEPGADCKKIVNGRSVQMGDEIHNARHNAARRAEYAIKKQNGNGVAH